MRSWAGALALVALTGASCGDGADGDGDLTALEEEIASLRQDLMDLEDRVVTALDEDVTIPVPASSGCAGLQDELARLDRTIIGPAALVTIELAPGTYECSGPIEVSHANGDRISIAGTGDGPAAVELTFPAGNGIVIHYGRSLRLLSNLTLSGAGGAAGNGAGVNVRGGGQLVVRDIVAKKFEVGIQAHGGVLDGGGVVATENRQGIRALHGGSIWSSGETTSASRISRVTAAA
jgi:hypothetical protein